MAAESKTQWGGCCGRSLRRGMGESDTAYGGVERRQCRERRRRRRTEAATAADRGGSGRGMGRKRLRREMVAAVEWGDGGTIP